MDKPTGVGRSAVHSRTAEEPEDRDPATRSQVTTTKVGLTLPAGLSYEQWEHTGRQLAGVLSSSSWWLGDWLLFGREHYSDRYERAAQASELQYQTLRNYAWVAGRYPVCRRRPELSFQHHAEIAALAVEEQERWLQLAQAQGWSVRRLRAAVRAARNASTDLSPVSDAGSVQRLTVPGERFRRWHEAAARTGFEVEQWVMATLDSAAEQVLAT